MKQHVLVLSLLVALAACGEAPETTPSAQPAAPATATAAPAAVASELDALYEAYWQASLERNPIQATSIGDTRYNDRLPNFLTAEYRAQDLAFERQWLDRISAIDPASLDGQARISYDMFMRERKNAIEEARFPSWMQPVQQFYNIAAFLARLGSGAGAQPFETVQDYDNWSKRAAVFPALFDTMIANMREGVAAGVVQPAVLMHKVLPQLDALVKTNPEDTLFWKPIAAMPADIPEADRTRITEAYRRQIADEIVPAYARLRAYIADEYIPKARSTVSLAALPDGEAWYAHNVRSQTTTDMTPAQIHRIGLDEVARIHGEMQAVMREVKFEGTLQDFFAHLNADPRFVFADEAALLAAYEGLRGRVEAGVPALFSLTPKAGFEIRPVEAFRAASSSPGSYTTPSEDGTRPGIFYINTHDLPTRKTFEMESLFLHEAIPGHHFQLALQQELTGLPAFRRFGGETAFAEGWGLYAESLGRELGVYTDPYQYFGRLQAELWRAIRLVVDTGLHSKGWSREQVIDYMKANSAASDTLAVSEAERYVAIPGQALAYKIGELKILELRRKAEAALGERFDVRAFHAEVLRDGAVPLDVLEAKIDRWLAGQAEAQAPG